MQNIKTILYEAIHRNKKTVSQIADETGISANYLYRSSLPIEQSGVRFPVDYLIPLMKATNNYTLLKHIAHTCGFVLVKVPSVTPYRGDKDSLVSDYQTITAEATQNLISFLKQPSENNFQKAICSLNNVMECSARSKKFIMKEAEGQFEFSFNCNEWEG